MIDGIEKYEILDCFTSSGLYDDGNDDSSHTTWDDGS